MWTGLYNIKFTNKISTQMERQLYKQRAMIVNHKYKKTGLYGILFQTKPTVLCRTRAATVTTRITATLYCDLSGIRWVVIMISRFDYWVYWQFFTITINYYSSQLISNADSSLLSASPSTNLSLSDWLVWVRSSLSLMLQPTVSWWVCLGIKHPSGAYAQIFITVRQLRVCWYGAFSLTRRRVCRLQ
jgi:hypothetical protein